MRVKLGGHVKGLVNLDMSRRHSTTGHPLSSAHADLYVRKGTAWSNVGDISNHTGIAREPTNQTKLDRDAIYEPRR